MNELVHYATNTHQALCGSDIPNQSTSTIINHCTCNHCVKELFVSMMQKNPEHDTRTALTARWRALESKGVKFHTVSLVNSSYLTCDYGAEHCIATPFEKPATEITEESVLRGIEEWVNGIYEWSLR